jgi:hypothetical protein
MKSGNSSQSINRLPMGYWALFENRFESHCLAWMGVCACFAWLWFAHVFESFAAGLVVATLAMFAYALSCFLLLPVLPMLVLSLLSVAIEWRWRIRYNRPVILPPPNLIPYSPLSSDPAPVATKKRGTGLLPLAIGLWIGASWGNDD